MFKVTDPEKAKEGKEITAGLAALKYELQHDRQLTYAVSSVTDGCPFLTRHSVLSSTMEVRT